jgi:hypothetical protein
MLKPKKKLVKKEIKQDTLVKMSSEVTVFYYEQRSMCIRMPQSSYSVSWPMS